MNAHWRDRTVGSAAALALVVGVACVAYDTAGPVVPALDGMWSTTITVDLENQAEIASHTIVGELSLRDTHFRGRFDGSYRIGSDTGAFGGVIRPESTLVVDQFGASARPIAGVDTLRRLFPWCDFTRFGTGGLFGRLRDDTLRADGHGSLFCLYSQFGNLVELPTTLTLHVRAMR